MKKLLCLAIILNLSYLTAQSQENDPNTQKRDNKQHFISLVIKAGSNINKDLNNGETLNPLNVEMGLMFEKRIGLNKNINTGLIYSNIYYLFDKSELTTLKTEYFEIPLNFNIVIQPREFRRATDKRQYVVDSGFFIEIGGFYSFNNKISTEKEDFDASIYKGSNFGANLKLGVGSFGFWMYVQLKQDLTPFISDLDPDFKRTSVAFGINIPLVGF